ncbi:MAG: PP2C family protein-serine/threonine phosphatase [Calditrichia bacterium]
MVFNRFRMILLGRIIFLGLTIFLLFYLLFRTNYVMVNVLLVVMIIYQIVMTFHFVEKTNRDLSRFFLSVRNADFTQTFSDENLGPSFHELNEALTQVSRQFLDLRSEKEQQFQYLQTVVQHVSIGLISFTPDGDVELINTAAKHLLNVSQLNNIKSLEKFSQPLADTLLSLKSGEKTLLKIGDNSRTLHLSINATEFKIQGQSYTLVSLQNIQSELERERMARELEIAHHVQESLLPKKNPELAGYDIAGICIPAKEVGGDYFDFIPLGKNKMGVVIGDVSGKGVPAAIYMTLTKGILQSYVQENISPRDVLIKLNRLLYQTIERGAFVSLFFAILDGDKQEVHMARAGHNPAIHYSSAAGKTRLFKPDGIGLGMEEGRIFNRVLKEQKLQLSAGDWLVFYTDGFTEAMNDSNDEFGEKRLLQVLQENGEKSAVEFLDSLQASVRDFVKDKSQFDDMTVIALKVKC